MEGLKRQSRLSKANLVIIGTLLVVHLVCPVKAHVNDDPLPALVLDDEPAASPKEPLTTKEPQVIVTTTVQPEDKVKVAEEPKLIAYETKLGESTPAKEEASQPSTTETPTSTTGEPTTTTSQPEPEAPTTSVSKDIGKDINVLLANKDDAENDLAAPEKSEGQPIKPKSELDVPVDTNKPNESNDNRYHYAFGDKFANGEDATTKSSTEPEVKVASAKPVSEAPASTENQKEEEQSVKKAIEKSPEEPELPASKAPTNGLESELDGKKIEASEHPVNSEDKTKSIVTESVDKEAAKAAEVLPTVDKAVVEQTSTTTTTTTTTTLAPSTTEKVSEVPSSPAPSSTTLAPVSEASAKPAESSSTPAKPVTADAPPKPVSNIPSIIATALGTALGAAANPLASSKPEPKLPASPASAPPSTTSAPSSTRKSTTDKWNRWSPSSAPSSTSPPTSTRRRPILPSIRRRFRPYNRFSPFPWGVDAYTPFGSEPEFMPADPTGTRPSPFSPSTTNKPRRRLPGSSTTESTRSGSEEESDESEVSSNRRRGEGANRRRHHSHNHNHHHHNNNRNHHDDRETTLSGRRRPPHQSGHRHRNHDREPSYPESAHFEPSFSSRPLSPGFGLFNTGSTGSGFDLLNPFSGWLDDMTKPRPPLGSPSFGSSGGSPLGGASSPGRRPGSGLGHSNKPVVVDGEYNDEHPHPIGSTHHNHDHQGGRDYDHHHDHDHRHDCHDDDYDHHHDYHHRDPYRPPREPYRPGNGDYDYGYGRRPNRPYRPRTGSESSSSSSSGRESERSDSSEASPSLYNAPASPSTQSPSLAPAEPKRVPSIFSPFESLFSSLDEDLFSLRSSIMDPPKYDSSSHAFDAVISSPKITLPVASRDDAKPLASGRLKGKNQTTSLLSEQSDAMIGNDKLVVETASPLTLNATSSSKEADSSMEPKPRARISSWSSSREPCASPEGSLICFFMHKKSPLLELFHRTFN